MKNTRAIRNNNPLNIRHSPSRWLGLLPKEEHAHGATDSAFCQFVSMAYGFRAAFILIDTYMRKHGLNTIERIIYRWAPPKDGNNTEQYIRDVCRLTGIGGKESLILRDPRLKDIVWAMAQIESGNGILQYRQSLEEGWEKSV